MIDFKQIQQLVIAEAISVESLLPHFVRVTDVDDSPDLTEVHPRDRTDLDLFFIPVDDTLFPKTTALIKNIPEITTANILGFGPRSQLYTHVDTVELEPYSEIDWKSVFIGMFVPSYDTEKVAVKIGDNVVSHNNIIIFDTQIPHSAWNRTDHWWISIRLAVLKTAFKL
jgi:hypothetical protein